MKTLIKQSLLVAVICATLTSYASSVEPLVRVEESKSKVFTLILNDLNLQQVQIFIKDENDVILYEEDLNITSGYLKKYDLNQLPKGDYVLEIESRNVIKVIPFEVSGATLFFDETRENKIFKPYIRQRGGFIDVMFKGSEVDATQVSIYDEDGQLLKKERMPAGSNIERIYDLSQLPNGKYSITFQRANRVFQQEVELL